MKTRYVALSALAIALATPAAAQMMPGAPMGGPMMGAPMSSEGFRQMALSNSSFEMSASQLAMDRARSPAVKRFARDMIRDHRAVMAALGGGGSYAQGPGGLVGGLVAAPLTVAGAATGAAVGAVGGTLQGGPVVGTVQGAQAGAAAGARAFNPEVDSTASMVPVTPRQRAMLDELAAARGAQFDALYGQYQVAAHREAVASFGSYAQMGGDPAMRNFAAQALPTMQRHLAMAERLPGARM